MHQIKMLGGLVNSTRNDLALVHDPEKWGPVSEKIMLK